MMTEERDATIGPRGREVRKLLNLWCWCIFLMFVLSFVFVLITKRGSPAGAGAFWWLIFGGYALKKGGLLDQPGGYRKAAWVTGALTALAAFLVLLGLGWFPSVELSTHRDAVVAPLWSQCFRVTLLVLTGWVTVALIRAAREAGDDSPFGVWPPCRADRRHSASIAALAVAALFLIVAALGLAGVIGIDPPQPDMWLVFGLFYGGATLLAGLQMWFGRWVAMTVGVLVPLCLFATIIFTTMGFAGYIPAAIAIPGGVGAVVCTIFLIRGVTCRPAT